MPVQVTLSFGAFVDVSGVPMAVGDPSPAWPLANHRRVITGDFGNRRVGERGGAVAERVHVAEDLPAPRGTWVLAPEAGRVVDVLDEFYKGSGYVLVQGDSGLVVVLGEIEPGTPVVKPGDRVAKAQPVARVGRHNQLHFETYTSGTKRSYQWWKGDPPPARLLNPTAYLQAAAGHVGPYDVPSLPPMLPPPPPPPPTDPEPVAPVVVAPVPVAPTSPAPAQQQAGGGLLLLAALALAGGGLG